MNERGIMDIRSVLEQGTVLYQKSLNEDNPA